MKEKKVIKAKIGAEKITFKGKTRAEIKKIARENNARRLAELEKKW